MKIIIERDDDTVEVHQNVTDYYIAVRKLEPMMDKLSSMALLPETRSYSSGSNLRELVKEVAQSLVELQEFLKEAKHGFDS